MFTFEIIPQLWTLNLTETLNIFVYECIGNAVTELVLFTAIVPIPGSIFFYGKFKKYEIFIAYFI